MLNHLILENLLLLDIETVPGERLFDKLDSHIQSLWMDRFTKTTPETEDPAQTYIERAALQSEFGKIICISAAYFLKENNQYRLRIKSVSGDEEKELLRKFLDMVSGFASKHREFEFTGHNIREFDIPFICRRALIQELELPSSLQFHGLRPWEVKVLDTMKLWRFGDSRHFVSLNLLAAVLGIPSPKDDIDGSQVASVYWEDHDLPRIEAYCRKDVVTVAQVLLRFKGWKLLQPEDISVVS